MTGLKSASESNPSKVKQAHFHKARTSAGKNMSTMSNRLQTKVLVRSENTTMNAEEKLTLPTGVANE